MKSKINAKNVIKKYKIEYVFAVIITIVIAFIFLFGNVDLSLFSSNTNNSSSFESELEAKLTKTIKNVQGAGKTNVVVTTDGTNKEEILKESITTYENGVKTTTESVVMVNGKPYVLKTYAPNVVGVVVVCEGANDLNVKLAITEILTTTLNVDCENIRILKMKWLKGECKQCLKRKK